MHPPITNLRQTSTSATLKASTINLVTPSITISDMDDPSCIQHTYIHVSVSIFALRLHCILYSGQVSIQWILINMWPHLGVQYILSKLMIMTDLFHFHGSHWASSRSHCLIWCNESMGYGMDLHTSFWPINNLFIKGYIN